MTSKSVFLLFFAVLLLALPPVLRAELVEYEIEIDYQTVNFTGKEVQAMTIGGTIPGTVIEAHEGDTLRVTFHNRMDVETSIHWHGILLPNDQDGVPYLTTMPIHAHSSFTYEYPVIQSGTYWYHSHTGLQEQRGVYGALIFYPREKKTVYDREYIVALSDWTNEDPHSVLRHLKSDGDYYALKKDTVQSWLKVLRRGWKAVRLRLKSAWIRMGPMDITDVGYDAFLLNGKETGPVGDARPGEKILLRVINMSASSHFDVEFAGGKMQIVAADGLDIEPVDVDRFRIAVAETYDVVVTVPTEKSYELRATAMDGSGYASGFLGTGETVPARDLPKPDLIMTDHSAHKNHQSSAMPADHSSHEGMDHSMHAGHTMHHGAPAGPRVLTYDDLRSPGETVLPDEAPVREITLRLTGNMERYIWSFNDRTLEESDAILIRKGENVRIHLVNETMMDHPIHLHGHFFRVLNKQGRHSPLKHTVDVKGMETTTIEFHADQEKDWLFHCHILYHMMTGMSRVFRYEGSEYSPMLAAMRAKHKVHSDHSRFYSWGNLSAQSNLVDGFLKVTDDRNQLEVSWDNNYTGEYDVVPKYLRNLSRFLDVYAGGEFVRNEDGHIENHAIWGFRYVLPMLVEFEYKMDQRGGQELGFHTELQLTDRLELHAFYELGFEFEDVWNYSELDITHEYRAELEYQINKTVSLVANYDSEHRGGGGVRFYF